MHALHKANIYETHGGFPYAAIGILFSVHDYNVNLTWSEEKVIDHFFESLKWEDLVTNPRVDMINFANLMEIFDLKHRWVYRGSLSTPPCTQYVYWNVLQSIYPIKEKHLK